MKILIVDDNVAVCKSIEQVMIIKGYSSVTAYNGLEAIKILHQYHDIQIVITDVLMPEMDGITLSKHIALNFPVIKVIAISGGGVGYSVCDTLKECQAAGIKKVLQKNFNLNELLSALDNL